MQQTICLAKKDDTSTYTIMSPGQIKQPHSTKQARYIICSLIKHVTDQVKERCICETPEKDNLTLRTCCSNPGRMLQAQEIAQEIALFPY
jgi:hypothetical protein